MMLETLVGFSNRYGSDGDLVLAGGGNTSAKDGNILYIKGSGTSLATITGDDFVKMDRTLLAQSAAKKYPEDDGAREAAALADLMAARLPSELSKRPSVETLLHNLFPQRYVLHLHPALINGLTCAVNGQAEAKRLFGDGVVWIGLCRPGYVLSKLCGERMADYRARTGADASAMLLQNHGVFIAADSAQALADNLSAMMDALKSRLGETPDFSPQNGENARTEEFAASIAALYGEGACVLFDGSRQAALFAANRAAAEPLLKPFTPDHIVYCRAHPLFVDSVGALDGAFGAYRAAHGYAPKIVMVEGLGFFAVAENEKQARTARLLFNDAMKIAVYARSFGGPLHMTDELTDFIVHWEVEAYRSGRNG